MTHTAELLPCPFTGRAPNHPEPIRQGNGQWRVWAGDYYIERPTRELAITAWNTRTDAQLRADRDALLEALGPFGVWAEAALAAHNGDPLIAGEVCRRSVSFSDFQRAAALISRIRGEG